MMRLKDHKVLVTGCKGIGRGIISKLAQEGASVGFTFSSPSSQKDAEDLLQELSATTGKHVAFQMNIAEESSIEAGFAKFLETYGSMDGLVNNAGITQDQLLLRMKANDFDRVIQTNLRGTFLCSRLAVKAMLKPRKGSIVHITSVIGHTGNPGQVNYAAAKAGIEAMSKSIASEIASRNIRSNCIAPGFIQTAMTDQLTEGQRKAILDKVPLARMGTPEDIANAAVFLLSNDSSYITGTTIHVNGGLYGG